MKLVMHAKDPAGQAVKLYGEALPWRRGPAVDAPATRSVNQNDLVAHERV